MVSDAPVVEADAEKLISQAVSVVSADNFSIVKALQ